MMKKFIFFLIFLFSFQYAQAANTGFLVNNYCHPTLSETLLALQADYPKLVGSFFVSTAGISYSAPNSFSQNINTVSLDSNKAFSGVKVFSVATCDPAIPIFPVTVFDPIVGAAFWSFAMTFVFGVYLLAKSSGIILSVIKNF